MSIEWVNQAIDDLRAWGRARGVEVDADEVRLLCDYASDYLDVNAPGDFTPAAFDELLLSIYPRKVITPPESAPQTVAAARTLVDYLQDTGGASAAVAGEMRDRIDDIEPRMSDALADESNFGMAKSLFSSIGPESLEQSIAIPSGELPDLGEAPCDCPGCSPLPGVRLVPPEDLLEALERVPLWTAVQGGGGAREQSYEELVGELRRHLDDAESDDDGESDGVGGSGDAGGSGDDAGEVALGRWARVVAYLVDHDTRGAVTGSAELDEELYDLFDMLYRLRTGVPVSVIGDYLQEVVDDGDVDVPATLERLAWCGLIERAPGPPGFLPPRGPGAGGTRPGDGGAAPGGRGLAPVAGRIGAAPHTGPGPQRGFAGRRGSGAPSEPYGDKVGATVGHGGTAGGTAGHGGTAGGTAGHGGTAGLTPLAVWALREHYLALGVDAPEAPDLAETDATGLVEGLLDGLPTEVAEDDIARWLSRRTPGEAAAQLLAAASGAPAVARGIAVTIVDHLGAEAEPEVRAVLDDTELRPHAIHWLASRGLPSPSLTQDELLWVSVDMLALAMPAAEEDPDIFAENMAASGPPAHLIEEMWRVDHPDVVDVLELLGRSIPDGTVAKAARKAAFKARSRAIR
ncbi:hypothetical protein MTP10_32770 [Nonomuraea sp. 3-1Str]|uniref:hypothetical protein n=1 Tax=Nonomuraea sp. 3-1Str TaxID=2929801 RepID=UPI0028667D12|nr:hypothetical protein [Nonomuraea sp. 3-1Str]MDR8413497.1 hypothetical protein [Nonomuraea sp. 3-1Str]